MADKQQTSGTHKTTQNARITSNASTTQVNEKLSKIVEDLAGHQQGFPEGAVELLEEIFLQKPPVDAMAQKRVVDGNLQGKIRHGYGRGGPMRREKEGRNPKKERNKQWGYQNNTDSRKKKTVPAHAIPHKTSTKTDQGERFPISCRPIKLRGATAIDTTTKVVTP
eukprot:1014788-Ditylum_brightwellii.AAC.2